MLYVFMAVLLCLKQIGCLLMLFGDDKEHN